jgi:hypothetical protein
MKTENRQKQIRPIKGPRVCDAQRHATIKTHEDSPRFHANHAASPRRPVHFGNTPVSPLHLKITTDSRRKYLILLILSGYFTFF